MNGKNLAETHFLIAKRCSLICEFRSEIICYFIDIEDISMKFSHARQRLLSYYFPI